MPGNPCHAGMVAPDTFGGRAPDRFALLDGIPAARGVVESLLDMLRRAVELARRGVGAVGDALRRALDALAGILGTGFGVLSLALVAVLVVAGVVLISADRRR
jgi:hypothetical protein